jgi:hypothetical protein
LNDRLRTLWSAVEKWAANEHVAYWSWLVCYPETTFLGGDMLRREAVVESFKPDIHT